MNLLDAPNLTPEPDEPPDPNVWLLPPEILEILEVEARFHGVNFASRVYSFCFGDAPSLSEERRTRNALVYFARDPSQEALVSRRKDIAP